jgi:hypothetical protein
MFTIFSTDGAKNFKYVNSGQSEFIAVFIFF